MPTRHGRFTRTAAALSRSPLGLLALCLVFVYGVAGTAFGAGLRDLNEGQRGVLVGFLVGYPLAILAALYRLVSRHHLKLYAPGDFREERHFVELVRPGAPGLRPPTPTRAGPALTTISPPAQLGEVVEGDDFVLIATAPSANVGPRAQPGFYVNPSEIYYVSKRHLIFLLRSPSRPSQLTRVGALPDGCRPVPSQHCDRELCALAEAADVLAS